MKFVSLIAKDRSVHVGALLEGSTPADNRILDFHVLEPKHVHEDMNEFIAKQSETLPWAKAMMEKARAGLVPKEALISEMDALLTAPVPHPVSCRDGYAFRQHVESARKGRGLPMIPEFDHFPIFYFTNHLAITGPGEVYVMEKALERLDFELEVAIVIGKEGRNIKACDADEYIFGYTIMNDWSARELQTQEMKLNLGPAKGKDFATSLGPYLVTRDELSSRRIPGAEGERFDLRMTAFHNGKQVSDGNLKDMNWTFGQIIERASYGVTLRPGEVIGSGTVGTGCYMELNLTTLKDNPVWLKPGDEFVLEVEKLGKLQNFIRRENT
ncbi:MAG: fumarylacetoacetate hydrolase family protein [Bdellovibrionales bacterium]|nr:fumarylacetoacetate hydrolase family protein [Bdellovibrionales bacterium]